MALAHGRADVHRCEQRSSQKCGLTPVSMHEPPFLSPQVPPDHVLAAATAADAMGGADHERPTRSWRAKVRTWMHRLTSTIRGERPARRG
jgi:hypothetical protein